MKLEDKDGEHHTEPSRFLHPGVFSLVKRKKVAVSRGGRRTGAYPRQGLAVYAIRMRQLWKRNSPTSFLSARVPGHEVIRRIEEVGPGVTAWKVDQRVGVGFFGGEDGTWKPAAVVKPPIAKMQL